MNTIKSCAQKIYDQLPGNKPVSKISTCVSVALGVIGAIGALGLALHGGVGAISGHSATMVAGTGFIGAAIAGCVAKLSNSCCEDRSLDLQPIVNQKPRPPRRSHIGKNPNSLGYGGYGNRVPGSI